jgi:hypothetical protein
MRGGPRPPGHRWYTLALAIAAAFALLCAGLCYRSRTRAMTFASLPDPVRRELAGLPVARNATREVERNWAARLDQPGYFLAPVGPFPCSGIDMPPGDRPARLTYLRELANPRGSDPLVALAYGTELIHANEFSAAARMMRGAVQGTVDDTRKLIERARDSSLPLDINDERVSTIVHLQHAQAVAELRQPGPGAPWYSLKNAIGIVKAYSDRYNIGRSIGDPTWSPLTINAPGCNETPESLSSHDLYNNLVYAYMTESYVPPGTAEEQQEARNKEFVREMQVNPDAVRALFLQQLALTANNGWKGESKVWALSNVERLLGWGYPADARLSLNAVRVLDEAARGCNRPWCAGLQPVRDALVEQALLRYADIGPDQQQEFGRAAARLLAESNVDLARVAPALETIRGWVPRSEGVVLDLLTEAEKDRRVLPRVIVGLSDAEIERGPWRKAAEAGFVDAAAAWASSESETTQTQLIIASRRLLDGGATPALEDLEKKRHWTARTWLRMQASDWFWGLAAAGLALLIGYLLLWIIVAVRDWRLLRTSFYNTEYDYLRSSAPPPRKGSRR